MTAEEEKQLDDIIRDTEKDLDDRQAAPTQKNSGKQVYNEADFMSPPKPLHSKNLQQAINQLNDPQLDVLALNLESCQQQSIQPDDPKILTREEAALLGSQANTAKKSIDTAKKNTELQQNQMNYIASQGTVKMTAEKNIRIKELIEKKRNEEEFNEQTRNPGEAPVQSQSQLGKDQTSAHGSQPSGEDYFQAANNKYALQKSMGTYSNQLKTAENFNQATLPPKPQTNKTQENFHKNPKVDAAQQQQATLQQTMSMGLLSEENQQRFIKSGQGNRAASSIHNRYQRTPQIAAGQNQGDGQRSQLGSASHYQNELIQRAHDTAQSNHGVQLDINQLNVKREHSSHVYSRQRTRDMRFADTHMANSVAGGGNMCNQSMVSGGQQSVGGYSVGVQSAMIRTRGRLPNSLMQRGAIFSANKSKGQTQAQLVTQPHRMSQTGGLNIVQRQSAAILYNQQLAADKTFPIQGIIASASNAQLGLGNKKISELTRFQQGSFVNLGAQKQFIQQQNQRRLQSSEMQARPLRVALDSNADIESGLNIEKSLSSGKQGDAKAKSFWPQWTKFFTKTGSKDGEEEFEQPHSDPGNDVLDGQNDLQLLSPKSSVVKKDGSPDKAVGTGFLPPITGQRVIQSEWQKPEVQDDQIERIERNHRGMLAGRPQEIVYLNIYHVSTANTALECLGFGIYHTAAQLYGYEFSYGGHDYPTSGIVVVRHGNSAGLTLKESIPVGITNYSEDEVNQIVYEFGDFWHGDDYDPFRKNCNNFTELLISHLCDREEYYFPQWINRFTKLGSILRMWFKPLQQLVGDIVSYDEDEANDNGENNAYDGANAYDSSLRKPAPQTPPKETQLEVHKQLSSPMQGRVLLPQEMESINVDNNNFVQLGSLMPRHQLFSNSPTNADRHNNILIEGNMRNTNQIISNLKTIQLANNFDSSDSYELDNEKVSPFKLPGNEEKLKKQKQSQFASVGQGVNVASPKSMQPQHITSGGGTMKKNPNQNVAQEQDLEFKSNYDSAYNAVPGPNHTGEDFSRGTVGGIGTIGGRIGGASRTNFPKQIHSNANQTGDQPYYFDDQKSESCHQQKHNEHMNQEQMARARASSFVDTGSLEEYKPNVQADVLEADLLNDANEFKIKGDNFYTTNKFEQAYKAYSIAIDLLAHHCADVKHGAYNAKNIEMKLQILLSMAEAAYQIGWWENVIVHAQEGIEISSTIARLHFLLGKSCLGLENYDEALQSLLKAQSLEHPDDRHKLDVDIDFVQKKIQQQKSGSPVKRGENNRYQQQEEQVDTKEMTFSPHQVKAQDLC